MQRHLLRCARDYWVRRTGERTTGQRGSLNARGRNAVRRPRAALGCVGAWPYARARCRASLRSDEPANTEMEPTLPPVRAIMSPRRAAHFER
jgi:hypothetical protein